MASKKSLESIHLETVKKRYAFRTTPTVEALMKDTTSQAVSSDDPIAQQYMPQLQELRISKEEDIDPIGDDVHSPVKGIVHRYKDRVLLQPTHICAVYCRYCFRREKTGTHENVLTKDERKAALNYIRENKDIWEVILTGGDPLILSPRQLGHILEELNTIEHVQVIRIHTRIPIADPERITDDLLQTLQKTQKALYIALHINHPAEIVPDNIAAIKALQQAGCILLSQSVLLKNINNKVEILEELFRKLVALGVKPYYLHHPDLAPGTGHFRLNVEEGQKIMKDLQNISGLCQPTYMLDIPGGHGKVPLTPRYIEELAENTYIVKNHKGESFNYPPYTGTKDDPMHQEDTRKKTHSK